ncbi:MAG: PKD domain-containing protein, partial [Candidatus Margulisbacteria bacterium]|nr:PKD domain-containing protein [Candidatus Margulisiibacteriota bacterium]
RPDGVIDTYEDQATIPSYTFDPQGDYDFKLEVTGADGTTKNYEIRSVGVYPQDIDMPQASIIAPPAANAGEAVNFFAADPDPANTYLWEFGDGTSATGPAPTKTFNPPVGQMATYSVKLTVTNAAGTAQDVTMQKITIVPDSVNPPSFLLDIPYAAEDDTYVPMSVENLPDPGNWTITWQYGDGSPLGSGISAGNTYSAPGAYQIVCTLTSNLDPSYQIHKPFTITVVPHGSPVPNLVLTPGMGQAPLNVTADAGNSYVSAAGASIVNYEFDWGDGNSDSGPQSARNHTFNCSDSSCAYTVRVTVADSNGNSSIISAAVVTWQ